VLAGRVVDVGGNPVEGVRVVTSPSFHAELAALPALQSTSDAEGRFVLREAEPEEIDFHLRIDSQEWRLVEAIEARTGATDVVVRVRATATLALSLARPALAGNLVFELRRAGAEQVLSRANCDHGQVRFHGLDTGRYDVRISLAGREVLRLDGIDLQPGAKAADPRLVDVDWLAAVRVAKVRLRDAAGDPVRGRLHVGSTDKTSPMQPVTADERGHAEVPYLEGQTIVAMHDGHRGAVVEPGADPVEVQLVPRARLRLLLPEGLSLPSGVLVHCDHEWSARRVPSHSMQWRDGEEMIVRPPGASTLILRLWMLAGGRLGRLFEQTIALPPDDALTDVVLDLDAETAGRAARIVEAVRARR
jgi:hypothetical protein